MGATSHPVEGAYGSGDTVPGKVDIERGGTQGLMSKEGLDGEQVGAVFIQVGAERMAKSVAGEPPGPSKAVFMSMDVPGEEKGINGFILAVLFWEEVSHGFSIGKPVLRKNVKGDL